jgi:hypothetical protein
MQQPKGSLTFHTTERVNRVALWLEKNFHFLDEASLSKDEKGGHHPKVKREDENEENEENEEEREEKKKKKKK